MDSSNSGNDWHYISESGESTAIHGQMYDCTYSFPLYLLLYLHSFRSTVTRHTHPVTDHLPPAASHPPHLTRHPPHPTPHTPHATRHTPHATRHTPHAT